MRSDLNDKSRYTREDWVREEQLKEAWNQSGLELGRLSYSETDKRSVIQNRMHNFEVELHKLSLKRELNDVYVIEDCTN